jgi:hypothetical protein
MMRAQNCFSDDSMTFLAKILAQSGTGQATAWPPSIVQCLHDGKPQVTAREPAASVWQIHPSCLAFFFYAIFLQPATPLPNKAVLAQYSSPSFCFFGVFYLGPSQDTSVENARAESKRVICDLIRDLLQRTGTQPQEVDILIVNCSLFSPTPSLCALAAHEFGMRTDLSSYNLSGMGCSASVIFLD